MRRTKEIFGKVLQILAIVLFASLVLGECGSCAYNKLTNTEGDGYDPQTSLLGYILGVEVNAVCSLEPGEGWHCPIPRINYPSAECASFYSGFGITADGKKCEFGAIQESRDKTTFRYWLEVFLKIGSLAEIILGGLICWLLYMAGRFFVSKKLAVHPDSPVDFQI